MPETILKALSFKAAGVCQLASYCSAPGANHRLYCPPSGTSQRVRVDWTVKMPDGKVVGTIKQANDVPSGSLDKGWGDTAYYATQAASEGIFQVVNSVRK